MFSIAYKFINNYILSELHSVTVGSSEMTHTQYGILEEELANLAQSMRLASTNHDTPLSSPINMNTPQPTIKELTPQLINGDRTTSGGHVASSQTMINIDEQLHLPGINEHNCFGLLCIATVTALSPLSI
eukprot:145364_1